MRAPEKADKKKTVNLFVRQKRVNTFYALKL